jgi:hypothetical protein
MNIKRVVNASIVVLLLCLAAGIGTFVYNATAAYRINSGFTPVPLKFSPEDSSSAYEMKGAEIKVYGGFVKGLQKNQDGTESLVVRALSPLPSIYVTGPSSAEISIQLENVNPDFYAKSAEGSNMKMAKVKVNTLQFSVSLAANGTVKIEPAQPQDSGDTGQYQYVVLGDNRDGYDTFGQIIEQANGKNPVFVIDNGDLVFSGKPNQYRLFDRAVSAVSTTLCTTLGNHDIRGNGRGTYTMLYGPAYYSFDFDGSHFVFLDSSRGWAEKTAIPEEQYAWLEKDLAKAQGKKIFVISHIPPHDPRSGTTANDIPNLVNEVKSGKSWLEQKMDNYFENKNMNHGFQDAAEAERFESMMSAYHVDTVYLSHIHSYLEYTKGGVRYVISGGAGAELLTENSYYHYMIAKIGDINAITMVELPSPANNYVTRYAATLKLFAQAMYDENPATVILVITSLALLIVVLVLKLYIWKRKTFQSIGKWLADTGRFAVRDFREVFKKTGNS